MIRVDAMEVCKMLLTIKDYDRWQIFISPYKKMERELLKYFKNLNCSYKKIAKNENKMCIVLKIPDNDIEELKKNIINMAHEYNVELTTEDVDISDCFVSGVSTLEKENCIIDFEKLKIPYNRNLKLPSDSKYNNMTPAMALKLDGFKAMVYLLSYKEKLDSSKRKRTIRAIEMAVKEWIDEQTETIDFENEDIEIIKKDIEKCKEADPSYIKIILNRSGYISFDAFIDNANDFMLRSAFASILEDIKKKVVED